MRRRIITDSAAHDAAAIKRFTDSAADATEATGRQADSRRRKRGVNPRFAFPRARRAP